jgi:TonB family protein
MLNAELHHRPALRRGPFTATLLLCSAVVISANQAPPAPQTDAPAGETVLFGRIIDETGAVVPGVEVRLAPPGAAAGRRTVTDGAGSYQVPRLTAGDYVVQTVLPGFASTSAVVAVPASGRIEHSVMLDLGSLEETITVVGTRGTTRPPRDPAARVAPTATPEFSAPKIVKDAPAPPPGMPVRVGGAIKAPAKLADVRPVYPAAAQKAGIEGWVILRAVIDTQGAVKTVDVLRSVEPDLSTAAMAAVKQWKFSPTLLNGAPADVRMTVSVNFVLK